MAGHDARYHAVRALRGGRHGNDGLPLRGDGRAADEVRVSAHAAVEPVPSESAQTWPVRSISMAVLIADHAFVFGDHERRVDVLGGVHFDRRIVVQEVEELRRPGGETADDLAAVQGLRRPVMTPSFASRMTPSEKSSVWIPRSFLSSRWGITASGMRPRPTGSSRRRARARRRVPRSARDFVRLPDHRPLQQRLVMFDQIDGIWLTCRKQSPSARGMSRVDPSHQQFRRFGGRLGNVHGDAQAAEAVLVRWTDHDQARQCRAGRS